MKEMGGKMSGEKTLPVRPYLNTRDWGGGWVLGVWGLVFLCAFNFFIIFERGSIVFFHSALDSHPS